MMHCKDKWNKCEEHQWKKTDDEKLIDNLIFVVIGSWGCLTVWKIYNSNSQTNKWNIYHTEHVEMVH